MLLLNDTKITDFFFKRAKQFYVLTTTESRAKI